MKTCSVSGCGTAAKTRGYCNMHYARVLRHGEAGGAEKKHAVRYDGAPCSIPACSRGASSRGWCKAHYKRFYKWGDPEGSAPPRQCMPSPVSGEPISARGLDGCVVDNCGRELVARGMCRRHYARWRRATPVGDRQSAKNLKRKYVDERFWDKVERGGTDECWPFTGSLDRKGYGGFWVSRERGIVPAHVFAVELTTGERCPSGMEGCHRCDNPPCVNPSHVYYGTRKQNVDDMYRRGRARIGERAANAKLTTDQVVDIRTRFAAGENGATLRAEYGLSSGHLSHIVNGKTWKHAGGPIKVHNKPGRRPRNKVD